MFPFLSNSLLLVLKAIIIVIIIQNSDHYSILYNWCNFSSTNDIYCEKIQITTLKSWIIKYTFYHEFSSAIELVEPLCT